MKHLLTVLVLSISNSAFASAFQSFEYDGASVGNAAAGGAAEANRPSTSFTNAGIGYDQNPVTISNLAIPDGSRTLLSSGTRYQVVKNIALDLGYTHAFIKNTTINDTALGVTLSGISKNAANGMGLQLTWDIV